MPLYEPARRVGFLLNLADEDIDINYDTGTPDPVTGVIPPLAHSSCNAVEGDATNGVDEDVVIECGNRVVVTVRTQYNPILPLLIPLQNQTFESESARTFVGIVTLTDDAEDCT